MSSNDIDNHDVDILPFADCELATDVQLDVSIYPKSKSNNHKTKKKFNKQEQPKKTDNNSRYTVSYIYFENTDEENNFITLIPYTGPSNTLHLGRSLYLPQLISNNQNKSDVSFQRFIRNYDQTIASLTSSSSSETIPLSIYIRFGISYITRAAIPDYSISLQDFTDLQNRSLTNKHVSFFYFFSFR